MTMLNMQAVSLRIETSIGIISLEIIAIFKTAKIVLPCWCVIHIFHIRDCISFWR